MAPRNRGHCLVLAIPLILCLSLCLLQDVGPWAFSVEAARESMIEQGQKLMTRHEHLEHVDVAVACVLFGFIVFVMGLFYLVNHEDDDIRIYSWEVLSTTIAIFTSVLLFQGLDGIFVSAVLSNFVSHGSLETAFSGGGTAQRQHAVILMSLAHFLGWFLAMHIVLEKLAFSKSLAPHPGKHAAESEEESLSHSQEHDADAASATACTNTTTEEDDEDEDDEERWERRIKCWELLLSHMTAFAAIAAWMDVQRLPFFSQGVLFYSVPVLMHIFVLFLTFRTTDYIRNKWYAKRGRGRLQVLAEWDAEASEGENEIAAISVSFLTVRIVLFAVDSWGALAAISTLLLSSSLFLALLFAWVSWLSTHQTRKSVAFSDDVPRFHSQLGFDSRARYLKRWCYIALDTSGMGFAWCLLYAMTQAVEHMSHTLDLPLAQTETISGILLASCTSITAFMLIFCINWVCDQRTSHDVRWKQFRSLVRSLGILIGFAWEQCFDAGVEAVAKLAEPLGGRHVAITKFLLACIVAAVVVPAWRRHILKTVLALNKEAHPHPHHRHHHHHHDH